MNIKRDSIRWVKYMFIMNFVTRLLLLVKSSYINQFFMGSRDLNIYQQAFSSISFLAFILGDGLMLALIMTFREIEEEAGRQQVYKHLNNIVNLLAICLGLLLIPSYIYIASRKPASSSYLYIGLPIVALTCIKVVYTGFLQVIHGFYAGPRGNLARAVIYVVYLGLTKNKFSLGHLMGLGVVTAVVQIIIAYYGTKAKDYSYEFRLDLRDPYLKKTLSRSILISISLLGLNIIDINIGRGGLLKIALDCLVLSVTTVMYPIFIESYYRQERRLYLKNLFWGLDLILKAFLAVMVVVLLSAGLNKEPVPGLRLSFYFVVASLLNSLIPLAIRGLMSLDRYGAFLGLSGLGFLVGSLAGEAGQLLGLSLFLVLAFYIIAREFTELKDYDYARYFLSFMAYFLLLLLVVAAIDSVFHEIDQHIRYVGKVLASIIVFLKRYNKINLKKKSTSY